ncbi:hypothetical protein YC2023_081406 [Brassica napus]
MWEMYLPRHNCTVTRTQGVHYCGFPIAMKAWMVTINGNKMSLSLWDCEPGRTGSPKGKLCKGSSVGSGGRGLAMLRNPGVREPSSQVRIGLRLVGTDTIGSLAFSPKCVSKHQEIARKQLKSSWNCWELLGNRQRRLQTDKELSESEREISSGDCSEETTGERERREKKNCQDGYWEQLRTKHRTEQREKETRKLMERDEDRRKGSRTEDGTMVLDVVTAVYGGYSPWNEPAVAKIEMQWSRAWRQRICWVRCPDLNNPDRILCDRDQRHTEGGSTGNRIEFADACGTRGRVTDTGMTEEQDGRTGSGALSMASVLSVQDVWLETKPSLFVYLGHVGMVG